MAKKYDIRNLYVATIAKQGDVKERITQIRCYSRLLRRAYYDIEKSYDWGYTDEKLGIFVKAENSYGRLLGYKHVLTDTIYYFPTRCTGGQYVIKPNEIHELCKYDTNLAKHFIMKNKSYRVKLDQINYIEDRFNNELNEDLEETLNV